MTMTLFDPEADPCLSVVRTTPLFGLVLPPRSPAVFWADTVFLLASDAKQQEAVYSIAEAPASVFDAWLAGACGEDDLLVTLECTGVERARWHLGEKMIALLACHYRGIALVLYGTEEEAQIALRQRREAQHA